MRIICQLLIYINTFKLLLLLGPMFTNNVNYIIRKFMKELIALKEVHVLLLLP